MNLGLLFLSSKIVLCDFIIRYKLRIKKKIPGIIRTGKDINRIITVEKSKNMKPRVSNTKTTKNKIIIIN